MLAKNIIYQHETSMTDEIVKVGKVAREANILIKR